MDLTTAAAIVTGGAGGVGSATVRRRAQIAATVVIVIVLPRFVTARYSDDWKDAGNMGALRLQLLGSPQV